MTESTNGLPIPDAVTCELMALGMSNANARAAATRLHEMNLLAHPSDAET